LTTRKQSFTAEVTSWSTKPAAIADASASRSGAPRSKPVAAATGSLCIRRGAVLSSRYIPAADFTPHHDLNDLGVYLWHEKVLSNCFCKSCGIFTYIGDGENAMDGYLVNLGCVEGIDPLALDISIIDGKSLPVIENN
jgi:hypothetical protein